MSPHFLKWRTQEPDPTLTYFVRDHGFCLLFHTQSRLKLHVWVFFLKTHRGKVGFMYQDKCFWKASGDIWNHAEPSVCSTVILWIFWVYYKSAVFPISNMPPFSFFICGLQCFSLHPYLHFSEEIFITTPSQKLLLDSSFLLDTNSLLNLARNKAGRTYFFPGLCSLRPTTSLNIFYYYVLLSTWIMKMAFWMPTFTSKDASLFLVLFIISSILWKSKGNR